LAEQTQGIAIVGTLSGLSIVHEFNEKAADYAAPLASIFPHLIPATPKVFVQVICGNISQLCWAAMHKQSHKAPSPINCAACACIASSSACPKVSATRSPTSASASPALMQPLRDAHQVSRVCGSVASRTDIDLGRVVGIAYKPHLVAAQRGKVEQPVRAGLGNEVFRRHGCKVHVPDAHGPVLDAVTMRDPSGLKEAECTAAPYPRMSAISLLVAASQMRTVLSFDAVTIRDPSGLKAAEFTSPSCPRRIAISLLVAASQMRAVLSSDAVTMRNPSGLKAAEFTLLSGPRRTAICLPSAASQMRAVQSSDAVTTRLPSGLKAAEYRAASCPRRTATAVATFRPRPLSLTFQ
jgi:hypothetical protein